MKNEKLINAWNKIEPDGETEERMLNNLLNQQDSLRQNGGIYGKRNRIKARFMIPVAACALLLIALTGGFLKIGGKSDPEILTENIGNDTINFYEMESLSAAAFAWDDSWGEPIRRELTAREQNTYFGDLPVVGTAVFRSSDNELMHYEGQYENTIISLGANGHPARDAVIGNETATVSSLNGTPVSAGYFVTSENSHGEKTIVYAATFEKGGILYYAETSGAYRDSEKVRTEISDILAELVKIGIPQELPSDGDADDADDTKVAFHEILGFDGYRIAMEEIVPGHYAWYYIADTDGSLQCIAEIFGFPIEGMEPAAYTLDINHDGVNELVCNCTYGTGAEEVLIYRNDNGNILVGRPDQEYLIFTLGMDIGSTHSIKSVFDPETQTFVVTNYRSDGTETTVAIEPEHFLFLPYIPPLENEADLTIPSA